MTLEDFPEMRAALVMTLIDYKLKSDERDRRGPRFERDDLHGGKFVLPDGTTAKGRMIYPDHSDIMGEALARIVAVMQGERAPEEILQEIEDHGGVEA